MTTQDCLTSLLEAIALSFAALMFIDFVTGLPLQQRYPKAAPNPLDMSAVFDAVDNNKKCPPMADKLEPAVVEDIAPLTESPIWQPLVAKTTNTPIAPKPDSDLSSKSREEITVIAKEHGIGGYRPGVNRRRTKAELLAELGKLQLV